MNFDFKPAKVPGLQVDLNSDSTPLQCFFELFTDEVQDALIQFFNSFAENKCQHSDTHSKDSVFASWKLINRYELMKFIAVVVAMSLGKIVWMRDCWSTLRCYETNWYKTLFSRKRFVAIYSTMLHAGEAEFESKEKFYLVV